MMIKNLFLIFVLLIGSCVSKNDKKVISKNIEKKVTLNSKEFSIKEPGVKECNIDLKLNEVVKGCEGEACWCSIINTISPKASSFLKVYEKPDVSSMVILNLEKGEAIKKAVPYLIKKKVGVGTIIKEDYDENGKNIHVETEEKLFIIQYIGEGYYSLCDGKKEKSSEMIKVVRKPAIEKWLRVILTNDRTGWTKGHWSFRFNEGCG